MSQNTVFAQVVKLIPRSQFQSWVFKHDGDKGIRTLDCWTWFGSLLFGQLSGQDSIRALERVFSQGDRHIQRLGFRPVCRSTLADANRTRPLEILDEAFFSTRHRARAILPRKTGFKFQGEVFALKQPLKIKKFLGTSVNAVKAQILVALIAYLLVQMIRQAVKGTTSTPETMAVLATMLRLKLPIMRLLGHLPRTTRYPPDRQLALPL